MPSLGVPELVIIFLIVILLFGASRLPWFHSGDIRVTKGFDIGDQLDLSVFGLVQNILNHTNIVAVNPITGLPDVGGTEFEDSRNPQIPGNFLVEGATTGFPLAVTAAAGIGDRAASANVAVLSFVALTGFLIGPLVARAHLDHAARPGPNGPLALGTVARELRIGQERLQRHLVGAPLELSALDARPSGDQLRPLRQLDLDLHEALLLLFRNRPELAPGNGGWSGPRPRPTLPA